MEGIDKVVAEKERKRQWNKDNLEYKAQWNKDNPECRTQ